MMILVTPAIYDQLFVGGTHMAKFIATFGRKIIQKAAAHQISNFTQPPQHSSTTSRQHNQEITTAPQPSSTTYNTAE